MCRKLCAALAQEIGDPEWAEPGHLDPDYGMTPGVHVRLIKDEPT
jgi:hypothetical protein